MTYSKFILAVFAVYIIYYVIMIAYDAFIKQNPSDADDTETEEFVFDEDEEVKDVPLDEASKPDNKKEEKPNTNDTATEQVTDEAEPTVQDVVVMNVEDQGIPMEELFNSGKELFANVKF